MILGVVVTRRWADLRIRVAGLMAAAMCVLSLGQTLRVGGMTTDLPLPWLPISPLPLLEHTIPGPLTLYMWLAIAMIVAVVVSELRTRRPGWAAPRLAALGLALALAIPAPPGFSRTEVPEFSRSFDRQGISDKAIVLVAPHFTNGAGAAPMLWAAYTGNRLRLYEAYAYVPDADGNPRYGPAHTQLTRIMERIQDDGVTLVARGGVRDQVFRDIAARGDHRRHRGPYGPQGADGGLLRGPVRAVAGRGGWSQLWRGVSGGS